MHIHQWIDKVRGEDTLGALADQTGLNRGTFYRQLQAGRVPAKDVVAIARKYGVDPLAGLVASGLLTAEEVESVRPMTRDEFLATLPDLDLLNELVSRVDKGGQLAHPLVTAPLNDEHPAMVEFDLAAKKAPYDREREREERGELP